MVPGTYPPPGHRGHCNKYEYLVNLSLVRTVYVHVMEGDQCPLCMCVLLVLALDTYVGSRDYWY